MFSDGKGGRAEFRFDTNGPNEGISMTNCGCWNRQMVRCNYTDRPGMSLQESWFTCVGPTRPDC